MCSDRPDEGWTSKHEPAFLKRCEGLNKPVCRWLPIRPSGAIPVPVESTMSFRMARNEPNGYLTFMGPQSGLHILAEH